MKAKWDHYSQYMGMIRDMIRGYDSHNSNILPLLKSARIKKDRAIWKNKIHVPNHQPDWMVGSAIFNAA